MQELEPARRPSTATVANSTLSKQNSAGASNTFSTKSSKGPGITVMKPPKKIAKPSQPDETSPSKPPAAKASVRHGPPKAIDLSSPKPRTNAPSTIKPFKRAQLPIRSPLEPTYGSHSNRTCPACHKQHPQGACELKAAGVEHCNLCGIAHFGHSRTCPHIRSETQVRAMLEALKNSNEPKSIVEQATRYLRGVKGTLVQQKKRNQEKAAALNGGPLMQPGPATAKPARPPQPGNAAKYVAYVPGAANGAPQQFPNGPPQREVPDWYKSAQGQMTLAEQQRMLQMQAHGQLDESEMENALRGFLGQG
jgi:chromodomain-helicase-DNA-binding protein 4